MKDLAPEITRQRFLIEAKYKRNVSKSDVENFLRELPGCLDLRIYSEPVVYSLGGDGKEENQGYDGFVALIDSGISIYVWENSKFLSVVIYTCKAFDEFKALNFTKEFFSITEDETMSF